MLAVATLGGLVALGPTPTTHVKATTFNLSSDLSKLEDAVAKTEAAHRDITPGAEKTFVWHNDKQEKTPLSIVYLHGFSATRQELAPVAQRVGEQLGANVFLTRLVGHGRSSEAMREVTLQRLIDDAREALHIGNQIGERTLLIGTSTGATLALWLLNDKASKNILGAALVSPNLKLKSPIATALTWPWADYWVPLIAGETYSWEPRDERHAKYWTTRYPTRALLPMAALTKVVNNSKQAELSAPALVLYSPDDSVVDASATMDYFARAQGAPSTLLTIEDSQDEHQHVIAGDIRSPSTTDHVTRLIVEFTQRLR